MSKKNGFSMLETIIPMVRLFPPARLRAWRLGWYFNSSIALITRARVDVDVEKKRVLHVGDNHPDGAALPARQVAGVEIGVVLQLLDCLDHSGAGGCLDHACIVEYPRDRSGGDLGAAGHLFQVHVPNIVQDVTEFHLAYAPQSKR